VPQCSTRAAQRPSLPSLLRSPCGTAEAEYAQQKKAYPRGWDCGGGGSSSAAAAAAAARAAATAITPRTKKKKKTKKTKETTIKKPTIT